MSRNAEIRTVMTQGNNDSGSNGPDSMFVVDLFENNQLVQTRELPGKSQSYSK